MKKKTLGALLIGAAFVCATVIYKALIYKPLVAVKTETITKSPILFQGLDEVPLTSICAQNIEPSIYEKYRGLFLACTPNIDEYAGQKIIKKNDPIPAFNEASISSYSEVIYDHATKRVAGITFIMSGGAYGSVMELLETKYGNVEKDPQAPSPVTEQSKSYRWIGDKEMSSFISLRWNGATLRGIFGEAKPAYTEVTIVTAAMRIVEKATEERMKREVEARKAEALKKL